MLYTLFFEVKSLNLYNSLVVDERKKKKEKKLFHCYEYVLDYMHKFFEILLIIHTMIMWTVWKLGNTCNFFGAVFVKIEGFF